MTIWPALLVAAVAADDPHLWLEDVAGEKALDWVRAQNAVSQKEFEASPGFGPLRDRLKAILDSKEKIAFPHVMGAHVYNFWKDDAHPRGVWRRTTLAGFKQPKPRWEVVIDVDALGKAEGESWVWGAARCLPPKYEKCLVSLSRGGADAEVVREFDAKKKRWVKDGFFLPEAKTYVAWKDEGTIYVGTDFGPGSLTSSGYPRVAKEWRRGTPLSAAQTIYEGAATDVAVSAWREFDHGRVRDFVSRSPSFYTNERFLLVDGKPVKIEKPDDASVDAWDDQLLLTLRSAWGAWPAGALLAVDFDAYLKGARDFTMLYEPKPNTGLAGWAGTKSTILVVEMEDVKSRLYVHARGKQGWTRRAVPAPAVGSFSVYAYDEDENDDYWFTDTGFLTPTTLHLASGDARRKIQGEPAHFDASGLVVTQHFATSKDGTKVPYFQIAKQGLALDGGNATILDGYGGFERSLTPVYAGGRGHAWLARGGVYVVANIRGGGEYGPKWHQAALKHHRQRAFDDFIAVAEDLIARKVTSTPKLGVVGGSNGGLLVGVMLTQRPDLFGAVVCQVPLLDMKRFHKLLAGASWTAEYGDPDVPEDWAVIAKYSPYENVRAGVRYPRSLFMTSTRDDRVHPGHARKMVAKLLEQKADVLYYENIEGGHGAAADNAQRAHLWALTYSFFTKQLGLQLRPPGRQ